MYKLINSARDTDDLSIGFERDVGKRQRELTPNKIVKGKFHERILLKVVFGSAVHQEKATYGLGHKITLTRNTDNAVLNKDNATNFGKIEVIAFDWYIPHYMPSISIQDVLFKPILSKTPTKLQYLNKKFFEKITTQSLWTFELGTEEGIRVPMWIIVGFQLFNKKIDKIHRVLTMIPFVDLR